MSKWLTSLGLTGFIAMCGYLAERGREAFLGLEIKELDFTRFADAFGKFALDSARLLLEVLTEGWVATLSLGVVLALAANLVARPRGSRAAALLAIAVCAGYLMIRASDLLVTTQAPVLAVNGVLTRYVSFDRDIPEPTGTARALRNRILCAHDRGQRLPCHEGERSLRPIERWYKDLLLSEVVLVVLSGLLVLLSTKTARRSRVRGGWMIGVRVATVMAIAPVLVSLLMLPYIYGKVLGSTTYPRASVYYLNEKDEPARMDAFILYQSSNKLLLYEILDAQRYVLTELPASRALAIRMQPQATSFDVLETHIGRTPQPPAAIR